MVYTAETWRIACAMLPFGDDERSEHRVHDADPSVWARHMRTVRDLGFREIDPTDNWVRVGDLGPARLADFSAALAENGLTIPAISTSRRSVMDSVRGKEYLEYSHRLLDVAAELGVKIVSFGFFQDLAPAQRDALWFWHAEGHRDSEDADARARAVALIRELAVHAAANGQEISLEMYEDTYIGTCDSAVAFLDEVDHHACGLNPDLGNFVRLHRPIEPIAEMFEKVLPRSNYWHLKNYLRDEDPATGSITTFPLPLEMGIIDYRATIARGLELGYGGPFLLEHYGADSLEVCARNHEYLRRLLTALLPHT